MYKDVMTATPSEKVFGLTDWQGSQLVSGDISWSGLASSQTSAGNWRIALIAVGLYVVMIPSLKGYVARYGKFDVKDLAFCWNSLLSIFSWCGVFACVPVMATTLAEKGLYFTCCAPCQWYSNNLCGFFVTLFIWSKIFELFDTVLLLAAKKPVIALQWWHHSTVLLYCWHSNSAGIATGLWFAAMNYSVHSVMYGYFAITATKYRKLISPYAIFITLAQLLQMVVGMFVTIKAVLYQVDGKECHVNRTNSVLGLLMYFSYFVLFLKLFIDNYVLKKKEEHHLPPKKKSSLLKLVRSTTRDLSDHPLLSPHKKWVSEDDEEATTSASDSSPGKKRQ